MNFKIIHCCNRSPNNETHLPVKNSKNAVLGTKDLMVRTSRVVENAYQERTEFEPNISIGKPQRYHLG